MSASVLVTGGLGYIGSHTCVELMRAGYEVAIVDNLSNSKRSVLGRIEELGGKTVAFEALDVRDRAALERLFARRSFDAVVHFAGLKAVGESIEKPLLYYDNNVGGTLTLLEAVVAHRVPHFVFSSSATVYGAPQHLPLTEDHPLQAVNPYGQTKQMIEQILLDTAAAEPWLRHATLRYFNPVGAHPSGRIGEDPLGVPNNLMPYVSQVAAGLRPQLRIYGADYGTPDGTGVRDYIHVVDLAAGHLAALHYLEGARRSITVNLGTGRGYSVLEMVRAFEAASGVPVPYEIVERRPGDVAACYADASLAARELGWRATRGLEDMCRHAWEWQSGNPEGFAD